MVGKMSWLIYPSVPITSLMSFVFVITLLPYAAKVYEKSTVYVRQLNQNLNKKYDRKLAKTLRPIAIEIGQFGRIDKCLLPEVIKHLTDYTTELLITFWINYSELWVEVVKIGHTSTNIGLCKHLAQIICWQLKIKRENLKTDISLWQTKNIVDDVKLFVIFNYITPTTFLLQP